MMSPTGCQPSQAQLPSATCLFALDTSADHPVLTLGLCPVRVSILISVEYHILSVTSGQSLQAPLPRYRLLP